MTKMAWVWASSAVLLACTHGETRAPPFASGGHEPLAVSAPPAPSVSETVVLSATPTPEPPPLAEVLELPKKPSKPHSGTLRSGLSNPMPGGTFAGYAGDTGLDIAGNSRPVYAIAAGKLDYSEWGHTRWIGPKDTANCVRIELDEPIPWKKGEHKITHLYYAHLSGLERVQKEGQKPRAHVEAGEPIGVSGIANGMPHLHLGLLLDGDVEQDSWSTILKEGEVRAALGNYNNGEVLPK